MRHCAIRKCKYDEIFALDIYAVSPLGRVRMVLANQAFCFWHYSAVQLHELRAGQFRSCPNRSFDDYVVKVLR